MKISLLDSEKEFFYALRYTLQNWEEENRDHFNCPANRVRFQLQHFDREVETYHSNCCSAYFDYDPGQPVDCPCDYFGSCEEAVEYAWGWLVEKENEYEN